MKLMLVIVGLALAVIITSPLWRKLARLLYHTRRAKSRNVTGSDRVASCEYLLARRHLKALDWLLDVMEYLVPKPDWCLFPSNDILRAAEILTLVKDKRAIRPLLAIVSNEKFIIRAADAAARVITGTVGP